MALVQGSLIEIADYNDLALEVNRLFSDNTSSLAFTTSNVILNDTAAGAGEAAGATRLLVPEPISTDYLVVTIDDVTLSTPADYNINYTSPVTITYVDPLAASVVLKVYNRETHIHGWGQTASVHPIVAGDPVLADEATLQAYLEANVNNLIDKVNIMETRIAGPSTLTRVAQGGLIYAADGTIITSTINSDVLSSNNYWQNDVATIIPAALTFERTVAWTTLLEGAARYTWNTYDEFRNFFNVGNEVRAAISFTGDAANPGFNNWDQVADDMGTLILNYDAASQSGINGTSYNIGAYELTSIYQPIFVSGSPSAPVSPVGEYDTYGAFADLVLKYSARIQENVPAAGNISIDIKAILDDRSFTQTVEGTITYDAGYKLADDITNNSAVFSSSSVTPGIVVLDDFNVDESDGSAPAASSEILSWSSYAADGTLVPTGVVQDTGNAIVTMTPTVIGNSAAFKIDSSSTIYVAGGETFSTTSALELSGDGTGDTSKTVITFAGDYGLDFDNNVEQVAFRISDIDWGSSGHKEQVTITAYNSSNVAVAVTITPGASLTVTSNVIDTDTSTATPAQSAHSALIDIAGPVARIEILYTNLQSTNHAIWVSDIHFDTIPLLPG